MKCCQMIYYSLWFNGWWELTSKSLYESFLNSHVLVKQEQKLHESWWQLISKSLYDNFLNSYILVKQLQELWESMRVDKQEFVWEFSQL